jgi:PAS domain S-box-containing protein
LRENDARLAAIFDSSAEGIVTFSAQGIIESANAGVRRIFGYRAEELVGKHIRFLMPAQASEEPGDSLIAPAAEIRLSGQRKDGSIFPIEVAVSEIKFVERPLFTGFIRDITRSKQAEEALRESEQRFRTIADSAPVLIWMADVAKECIFVNRPWLIFTGRTAEQVSGAGWIEAIAAEDRQLFLERFHEAVDTRQPFVVQFRLRRRDGAYRWLITSGVPSFDCAGQFSGYIGSCTDITEQKEAQRAAQELSGLLIRAQEDHRARLARELHDDITQRLARFAIDIGRFTQRVSLGEADEDLIRGVADGLAGLSRDVHLLSYELHPSALIDLGLEAALSSECEQFSRRELMVVELKMRQLPAAIPRETAVGLFRIVQEGLRNAVRHGRASRAEVSLLGVEDGLQLVVHDNGIGFDTAQRRTTPSLGIASMRERTRLLGGEFDLESEPGRGTTIIAWAPL